MRRDDLVDTLLAIDEEASLVLGDSRTKPAVIIVGGAAFMLRDLTRRSVTHDVDVLQAAQAVRQILAAYPVVNGYVASFADQIPYNFEDRLVSLEVGARTIKYMTPSTEDLVVMKLYAERPNDVQDIDAAAERGAIDWQLLDRLVYDPDESKASALSERRYQEMVGSYERFCERWRCESDV